MDFSYQIRDIQNAVTSFGMAVNCLARVAGMQAENQACINEGCGPKYDEAAFTEVIEETGTHWNGLVGNMHHRGGA